VNKAALLALFVCCYLLSNTSMAIDSGNLYRFDNKFNYHFSVILEEEIRTLDITSSGILQGVDSLFLDPANPFTGSKLTGDITSYNLLLRGNMYFGEDMSVFADVGLFNDVQAVVHAPFFAGGGGRITQEVYPDTFISVYGKAYVTDFYRYQLHIDLGEKWGDYLASFDGRIYMAVAGAVVTNHIKLETIELFPYIGAEASFVRSSSEVSDFRVPGATTTLINRIDRDKRNAQLAQEHLFHLVIGATIKRHNQATIRVETKVAPGEGTLSLGIGMFL